MKIDRQVIFILHLTHKKRKVHLNIILYKQRYEHGYISTLHYSGTTTNVFFEITK